LEAHPPPRADRSHPRSSCLARRWSAFHGESSRLVAVNGGRREPQRPQRPLFAPKSQWYIPDLASRQAKLEYRVLGPVEVRRGDESLPLGQPKQRAVLALLLLDRDHAISQDQLIEKLWPESAPGKPRTAVQGYISGLRKTLGAGAIETSDSGYVLRADSDQLDAHRFESLVREGRESLAEHRPEQAAETLRHALALWNGRAFADFTYDPWAQSEIGRLEEFRLVAQEELADALLQLGEGAELAGDLEALLRENPLRERLSSQLILALYRSGRQTEALATYQRLRERLLEELGIDPNPELQELYRKILNQDETLRSPRGRATPPHNLPTPSNALIGRVAELEDVRRLLTRSDVRLLTLTGTGGTGKTRLALRVAADALSNFADGVFLISLAPIRDPAFVIPRIMQTLLVHEQPGQTPQETLVGHLADRQVLLVLDNFEQVVDAAPRIAELLAACRGLNVLATSRTSLDLTGENEYPVPPLLEADGVALFAERASAKRPDFSPNGDVAEICRRLDCLPLAIELAAARTKVLPTSAILAKLDQRLSLLTRGSRDLPPRQQTLRAAIDWSYDLLSEKERHAFSAVATFAGGFTSEAAEALEILDADVLGDLVDRSLVRLSGDRYAMLETIREYAAERLRECDDHDELRERHARYYVELTARARLQLDGPEQALWLRLLDLESANIRLALTWALERGDGETALRLAVGTARVWRVHGQYAEGRHWLESALAHPAPPEERAKGYITLASMLIDHGHYDEGARVSTAAIELCRGEPGDQILLGKALNNLAVAHLYRGDLDGAATILGESLELARVAGDRIAIVPAIHNLGEIALARERADDALELFSEALTLARDLGHSYLCALCLSSLGAALIDSGHADAAAHALTETLTLAAELEDTETMSDALEDTAAVVAERGEAEAAARLLGAAAAQRERTDTQRSPVHAKRLARLETEIRRAVGEEAWAQSWSAGSQLQLEPATREAMSLLQSRDGASTRI
jgi:predicted ATPase/DNA-binding SARP family transcriptional activator